LKKALYVLLPLAAGLIVGCNSGSATGGPVAVVNNEQVTKDEYYSYLERKRSVLAMTPQGPVDVQVAGSLGLQALRDLINRKLLLQVAKDQNVAPNDDAIKKELDFQTKRNPQFVKSLQSAGMSLAEIRQDLSIDLARFNLISKGITVTQADVDAFIKNNPSNFLTPAQAELFYIQVGSEQLKNQVDSALKQGTSFPVAAARYSEAPNARATQGAFPIRAVDQMPAQLQAIVNKTKVGTASNWIPDGGNFLKFFVQNRTAAEKIKIDETVKESVRRQIAEERGSQANDLGKTLQERLRTAKVDVKLSYLADGWKSAMDALKAEDASSKPVSTK